MDFHDTEEISYQEITVSELALLNTADYMLVDVRDEMSYLYGHLPEAVHIPLDVLKDQLDGLRDKKVIVYCRKGEASAEAVKLLEAQGIDARSLKGGYLAWLMRL